MEMLYIGILVGAIVCLILILIFVLKATEPSNISEELINKRIDELERRINNERVGACCDSIHDICNTSRKSNGVDYHYKNYEIGSRKRYDSIECLIEGLRTIKVTSASSRTEKEMLDEAIDIICEFALYEGK